MVGLQYLEFFGGIPGTPTCTENCAEDSTIIVLSNSAVLFAFVPVIVLTSFIVMMPFVSVDP